MGSRLVGTRLRSPVNVTWEITNRCNLQCVHCLSDAGPKLKNELTALEALRVVDQLAEMKVFQINIGGGEPFLRKGFIDLLRYAHEKGIVTCVSTNGMLIDNSLASELAKLERFYMQISLDGATAEVNDAIRGKGTYNKIISALEYLSSHGVDFSINTVLTKTNFPQLAILRSIAAEYDAELRVSRFRPSGRGKESQSYLGPDAEQLEAFAEWLAKHDMVRTGDSFFCLTSEHRRRKGLDMCGAAKMTCCVSPVGNVYPCAFLQEESFWVGNIGAKDFKSLWDQSPILNQLRNLNVATCRDCVRFESCRGGCPAMAYHTYNDVSMPDPECLVNLHMKLRKTA